MNVCISYSSTSMKNKLANTRKIYFWNLKAFIVSLGHLGLDCLLISILISSMKIEAEESLWHIKNQINRQCGYMKIKQDISFFIISYKLVCEGFGLPDRINRKYWLCINPNLLQINDNCVIATRHTLFYIFQKKQKAIIKRIVLMLPQTYPVQHHRLAYQLPDHNGTFC